LAEGCDDPLSGTLISQILPRIDRACLQSSSSRLLMNIIGPVFTSKRRNICTAAGISSSNFASTCRHSHGKQPSFRPGQKQVWLTVCLIGYVLVKVLPPCRPDGADVWSSGECLSCKTPLETPMHNPSIHTNGHSLAIRRVGQLLHRVKRLTGSALVDSPCCSGHLSSQSTSPR
jgi:hypothetical protein